MKKNINTNRLENLFIDLCKIKSESKNEKDVFDFLQALFTSDGYEIITDDAHKNFGGNTPNMFIKIDGTLAGPTVMLSAHIDTVIAGGNIEPVYDGEYIRSKGNTILGADDKAGIAGIIEAIRVVKENNVPHLPLLLAITVSEEIGLLGAKYAQIDESDAQYGVVLDTGGPIGTIINEAPYHEYYKIKVFGKSAHAGIEPENGINAIKLAAKLIEELPTGRIDETSTTNIAQIKGGVANNIVPEVVTILGEVRSTNEQKLITIINEIKIACDSFTTGDSKIIFSSEREYDGYKLEENSKLIKALKEAAIAIGQEPIVKSTGGGSDANFFNKKGIETTVISCGMAKVHTHNEEIKVSDLHKATEMVLSFICDEGNVLRN